MMQNLLILNASHQNTMQRLPVASVDSFGFAVVMPKAAKGDS